MTIVAAIAVPHPPLLIPGIGDVQKPGVAATQEAYERAARFVAASKPTSLAVFSPHATLYRDYFHISPGSAAEGDFGQFVRSGPPRYRVRYDEELAAALERELAAAALPGGRDGERESKLDHGLMVPLHFLQEAGVTAPALRIGLSGLSLADHWRFGQCLAKAAVATEETQQTRRRLAIVASGDLSHYLKAEGPYGYRPQGPAFDAAVCKLLAAGDFAGLLKLDEGLCEQAGECGLRSLVMLGGTLEELHVSPELLSYEGPYGVGYAVATFAIGSQDD